MLPGVVVVVGLVVVLGGVPSVGEAPVGGHGEVIVALVPVSVVELPIVLELVVDDCVPAPTWLEPCPTWLLPLPTWLLPGPT